MSDCSSCRSNLELFNPTLTGLPAFAIYPEKSRRDSLDLEYSGSFALNGISIIFNDDWYHRLILEESRSGFFGLDKKGNVILNKPITEATSDALKNYLRNNHPSDEPEVISKYHYTENHKYEFNFGLSTLRINRLSDNTELAVIRPTSVPVEALIDKLPPHMGGKLYEYGEKIKKSSSYFALKLRSFQVQNDQTIYLLYQYWNTPDSVSQNIRDEFALVKFDTLGKFMDIIPINYSHEYLLYDFCFLLKNDTLLINTCSLAGFEEDINKGVKDIKYIQTFSIKNGIFESNGFASPSVPFLHQNKYFENELSSFYSEYPYISNYLTNEVSNVENNKMAYLIPDSLYRNLMLSSKKDLLNESFHAYGIRADRIGNPSVIYNLEDNLFLNYYTPDMEIKKSVPLNINLGANTKINFIYHFPKANLLQLVYLKEGHPVSVILPFDLFS